MSVPPNPGDRFIVKNKALVDTDFLFVYLGTRNVGPNNDLYRFLETSKSTGVSHIQEMGLSMFNRLVKEGRYVKVSPLSQETLAQIRSRPSDVKNLDEISTGTEIHLDEDVVRKIREFMGYGGKDKKTRRNRKKKSKTRKYLKK